MTNTRLLDGTATMDAVLWLTDKALRTENLALTYEQVRMTNWSTNKRQFAIPSDRLTGITVYQEVVTHNLPKFITKMTYIPEADHERSTNLQYTLKTCALWRIHIDNLPDFKNWLAWYRTAPLAHRAVFA